ncbi:two-component system VirA-like sensor kinase [Rhizobium halophilum]|uniref:two-component system VirA-like sensor kinase n=1 Tax=Rhizobium halophilum TaxID=2846852 RepID=UPI001EFC3864|nr:two-component system VirA-like sensor kinase [Rhizobium halophilum]MCF6371138.1 two-component system VirA-like sensor kinase [Rhizobium halophilum]
MARGLKPRSTKIGVEAWLIAVATLAAISLAVIAAGRDAGRPTHEAVMMTLRAIDVNHASLQRDVLRARAGLLMSYDPLVDSVVALRNTVATLADLLTGSNFESSEKLEQLLHDLHAGIEADESLVEKFKTRNALLQNSISVFGQTLTGLHQSRSPTVKLALVEAGDLGNLMLGFSTAPDPDLKEAINMRLNQLQRSTVVSPAAKEVQTLTAHANMILSILPTVDAKVAMLQASPTPARAGALQSGYLEEAAQANSSAAASRVLLGATAISLCIYVFVLVYRLRNQTERLKRLLHFEQVIANIKADMFNAAPHDFPDFMERALNVLNCFFRADTCGFAIVDIDAKEIRNFYRLNEEGEAGSRELSLQFATFLQSHDHLRASGATDHAMYLDLLRPDELTFTRNSIISGFILGSQLPDGHVATLLLLFDIPRPKLGADEIALVKASLQILMEFVETDRRQQERDALEHRLEHSQRLEAVGTLAGGIAHEFNNVLGAILGYGEMALQLLRKPSMTRHYVQEILTSGERAKHIVDQILTFSRKRERAMKPFNVSEAVADIMPLLQVTLRNTVTLTAHLCEEPAVIEGNPVEVHQIVMNLCKNAMEASSRGQEVTVEVKHVIERRRRVLSHGEISPGTYVCLSVQDRGQGIPDHVLPHIFEPFYTTRSMSGGTGLGLSAVHGSVSAFGGSIHVESSASSGTRFDLYFPASSLPPLPIRSFYDDRAVPTGNGERIMILEKDRSLLEMYEEKVAALGYEALGYSDLSGLEDAIKHNGAPPDLLIIDASSVTPEGILGSLRSTLPAARYLLLVEDDRGVDPREFYSLLKKPFSSQALAYAISDIIHPSS